MKVSVYTSNDTAMVNRVKRITDRLSLTCLEKTFDILVETDKKDGQRVYIQLEYTSSCTKTGDVDTWRGRKWYLSEHMIDDEIVKTVYAAFQAAVIHEIMEGFKYDGIIVFNPHVSFEELVAISHKQVQRDNHV